MLAQCLEDGADPSAADLHAPFEKAPREGHLIPILFTSARLGPESELLHVLAIAGPEPGRGQSAPCSGKGELAEGAQGRRSLPCRAGPQKHVLAHVFKVVADPYMGKIGIFRVHQGTGRRTQLFVGDGKRPFKAGPPVSVPGQGHVEVDELDAGDIGAIAKVEEIEFDCVLHDPRRGPHPPGPLDFPRPMAGLAVETKKKGDEQRLFDILGKLGMRKIPCFVVERHPIPTKPSSAAWAKSTSSPS